MGFVLCTRYISKDYHNLYSNIIYLRLTLKIQKLFCSSFFCVTMERLRGMIYLCLELGSLKAKMWVKPRAKIWYWINYLRDHSYNWMIVLLIHRLVIIINQWVSCLLNVTVTNVTGNRTNWIYLYQGIRSIVVKQRLWNKTRINLS